MTKLSVNLNKIALLRNQRDFAYPDPLVLGELALKAGAHGLTVHPRPDARHTRSADVFALKALVGRKEWQQDEREFNVEGYPDDNFLTLIETIRPDQVTLVPDAPDARTSSAGWALEHEPFALKSALKKLVSWGLRISLFVEASPDQALTQTRLAIAKAWGAMRIELYTGPYAEALMGGQAASQALAPYQFMTKEAVRLGLAVNAGHDLSLDNLALFHQYLPEISEVSIGHALIADCLIYGMEITVGKYLRALGG